MDVPNQNDDENEVPSTTAENDNEELLKCKEKTRLFFCTHWRGIVCFVVPLILIPIHLSFPPEMIALWTLYTPAERLKVSFGEMSTNAEINLCLLSRHPSGIFPHEVDGTWFNLTPRRYKFGLKYQWCAYTLVVMAIFWVTECIPLAVTSFLPIFIFPLTGIMSTEETCACYMNDTIIMFLASMWLAYAVEQSGLHMRLALYAIRIVGYSHYRLLFTICFTTMFISMWITNTAATTMMVPIIFALLQVFEEQNLLEIYNVSQDGEKTASDITICYFCAATFSATIGGIGTLVGTATNLVFKGLFSKLYPQAPEYLSFPNFSAFSIPYMLLMEIAVYIYFLIVYLGYLRPKSDAAKKAQIPQSGMDAAKQAVTEDVAKLGSITVWEILVILLFTGAILSFFFRSPQILEGWGDAIPKYYNLDDKKFVRDSAAAILFVFLMLLIPSSLIFFKNFTAKDYGDFPEESVKTVLIWEKMNEVMPYSFMFLLGGGFALSNAAKKEYTDLNGKIGLILKNLKSLPNILIILLIIIFTIFITNFASNVAVCNVIAPIAMQLAKEINQNPLWYDIAAGFSSSYALCLPVGTPGNLVVQSAANIPTSKMIQAGIVPTITTIIISWFCICFWAPVVWPDLLVLPDWTVE